MAPKTPRISDFDADDFAVSADQHAKDISGLDQRISALEAKFGTPIAVAETLHETANVAVKMKEMLEANFLVLLCKNEPIRNEIKCLIKATDRDFVQAKVKQYGTWMGAAFLFLMAQVSIELIKWTISLFHGSTPPVH